MADEARQLCDAVQNAINERRRPRIQRELAQLEHERRRAAAIERNRFRIIEAAMAKLGVDTAEIRRLQREDSAALTRFLDSQQEALQAEARQVADRRQRLIRELRTRRIEYKGGNPFTLFCRWNATQAYVDPWILGGATESTQVVLGAQLGANSVEASLKAQVGSARVFIDFHFPWDNTTGAGWLEVLSWVYAWGAYRIIAPAECFGSSDAWARVSAWMALWQNSTSGLVELGVTPVMNILDRQVRSLSSWGQGVIGASGSPTSFSDYVELVKVDGVPIAAGHPVDVVVTVELTLGTTSADEASTLDCTTGSYEINVPSVWMKVHTGEIPQP
jgi:hypothetical protein